MFKICPTINLIQVCDFTNGISNLPLNFSSSVQCAQEVDPHAQLRWALLQYFHPQDLHPSGTVK
jgi:hypothetical protein